MKKLLIATITTLFLAGCTTAPFQPSMGTVYSDTKAPLQLEYNKTDLGKKVGTATTHSVLGLVAWGDASIQAGAKDGNIKTVKHTDYEFLNVLFGIYTETTVFVYGD